LGGSANGWRRRHGRLSHGFDQWQQRRAVSNGNAIGQHSDAAGQHGDTVGKHYKSEYPGRELDQNSWQHDSTFNHDPKYYRTAGRPLQHDRRHGR
jgi:hypothetical protein